MSTIAATNEQRDKSVLGRLHFWNVAISMANDRPLTGVGYNGYQAAYNAYDASEGEFGASRSVHSVWLGVLAELGYPGIILYLVIVWLSFRACHRVRKKAARGEISDTLGRYAIGLESALVAFVVGGTFVPFQYCEMLWHFFALTIALDTVAVAEAATARERATTATPVANQAPSFAWGPSPVTQ